MNRKVMGALAGVAVVVVVVWFFFLRGGGDPAKPGAAPTRSAQKLAATAPTTQTAAARGFAQVDSFDVDVDGPLRLEGQVQGPDGAPISGAEVEISTNPRRTAKTEDDGSFAFDKLVGRTYYLSATSKDLVGGPVTYKLIANGDPVVIRMLEGSKLEVLVQDADKKPIADAEVKRDRDHAEHTGADGKALLKPVHSGWAAIEATAKGYAPGSSFTSIGAPGSTGHMTITLKKGYPVSGKVVDEQGAVVANAHVNPQADGAMWGGRSEPVITNERGEFELVLAAGSHRFHVTDGEHAPTTSPPVTVKDGAVTGVVVTMKGGGMIVGRVDDKDGKPVAFATVKLAHAKGNNWNPGGQRSATTDKAGVFEIHGLTRVKMQIRAESDLSASKISNVDLTDAPTVRDVVLVLDVSGTITGIVVDEAGQPVPEVQVHAMPDILLGAKADGMALAGLSSATTDASGNFAVHGLPDGAYRLWGERTGGGFRGGFGNESTSAHTGDKNVKLTLPAPGTVIGKVMLDGKPPVAGTVSIGFSQAPTPVENGEFTVKDLEPGKVDAVIRGPEFTEYIKRDVKIEPGKTTDLGTIDVSRGRQITGRVLDANNTPVAGARVKLGQMLFTMQGADDDNLGEQRGMRYASTDQDGSFTISGVNKKANMVAADHPDKGQSLATNLPAGDGDPPAIVLQLRGWGSIVGTVTQHGQPVAQATVTETPKNGGAQVGMTQTDAEGDFTMLKVSEGPHTLQVMRQSGMGVKTTSAVVEVVAGQQAKAAIEIPSGNITLTVAIKPQNGATVNGAMSSLFVPPNQAMNAKQLFENMVGGGASMGSKFWMGFGTIEFDELMPGDYNLCSAPVTGPIMDQQFFQRTQEHADAIKAYCMPVHVTATTTVTQTLPSMDPLPQ